MVSIDARPTLEAPDDDPHLWLENVHGENALAWVEEQHQATLDRFGGPIFKADQGTLSFMFDQPERIPYVRRRAGLLYNFWKDVDNPRGLWRRTAMESYQRETPDWQILLDLDALAKAEGEDWTWAGATTLPPAHDRAIVRLSRGGSDAVVLREFDLTARIFVKEGFTLPEAKGGIDWLDRDHLLLSSAYGQGMATTSGYSRTVRLWRRGESVENASVLLETDPGHVSVIAGLDSSVPDERVYFGERLDFFHVRWQLGDRSGPKIVVDLPTDAALHVNGDRLAVRPRQPWTVGDKTYAADTVLGISLSAFLEGSRAFEVLFEPVDRRHLRGFFWCGARLVIAVLNDLAPAFEYWTPSDEGWHREVEAGLPDIAAAGVGRLDAELSESTGDLLISVETPTSPPKLSLLPPGEAPTVLRQAPQVFDPSGLVVSRHDAIASDGERIPYIQVGPKGETGDAPVHLTAYGGFRKSKHPYYRAVSGKLWLERGGTGVVANIRGGGEYGTAWHDAGRRENKPRSHDDFAAVAADLVARGVTRPARIAAEGGSNGGILITNMLTRYPERFGALFCTIPLIDMRRYNKLLAGASWIAEYGDPDKEEDWAFLQHYSAYHTAMPGQKYPPILLATSRRDDRVHPGHARKMAAKLQAMGYEAHFYEPAAGGHGYGKDNAERAAFIALGHNFMRQAIGWAEVCEGCS